jgi:hypothetical protein
MAGGFRPVQDYSGGGYTGKVQTFGVDSGHGTLLSVGDLMVITGQSDANGLQEVDAAAAAGLITGAIVSILPNFSDLEASGLAAGTAGKVMVTTDPLVLFECETSTTVAATDVGQNAELLATAATASGGLTNSNMVMNSGTFITATAQLRLEWLKDGGTAAGSTVFCRINESTVGGVVGI